ncbi:MAG: hypothetical protein KIC92_07560 [Clostridiales bacterium]|nr:hypothetical protein [Clostridiales bacterium]
MSEKCIRRSIYLPKDTLEKLEKIAINKGLKISEVIRMFIDKGLNIESSREDIDFITDIIRQELTSIYRLEDIKEILDKQTNRLAKMMMKIGKMSTGQLFLLINMFLEIVDSADENKFDGILEKSMRNGVNYMQKKDFAINDFLQDTDNLKDISENL